MNATNFQKSFGPGSATPENMKNVAQTLRGMLNALRDDGKQGYFANAAFLGKDSIKTGFAYSSDNKSIYINVDHSSFGKATAGTAIHESGHNLGLRDERYRGIEAYRKGDDVQREIFRRLPTLDPAAALRNADTFTDYVLP